MADALTFVDGPTFPGCEAENQLHGVGEKLENQRRYGARYIQRGSCTIERLSSRCNSEIPGKKLFQSTTTAMDPRERVFTSDAMPYGSTSFLRPRCEPLSQCMRYCALGCHIDVPPSDRHQVRPLGKCRASTPGGKGNSEGYIRVRFGGSMSSYCTFRTGGLTVG